MRVTQWSAMQPAKRTPQPERRSGELNEGMLGEEVCLKDYRVKSVLSSYKSKKALFGRRAGDIRSTRERRVNFSLGDPGRVSFLMKCVSELFCPAMVYSPFPPLSPPESSMSLHTEA